MPSEAGQEEVMLTRWIEMTPISIADYAVLKHRTRMETKEGVRQALARQDMEPIA